MADDLAGANRERNRQLGAGGCHLGRLPSPALLELTPTPALSAAEQRIRTGRE